MLCCPIIVFIDLDGTVWDHKDISSTNPPYRCVGDLLYNSTGTIVKLYSNVREFLSLLKTKRLLVYTLSWNDPTKALKALECLNLKEFFDGHVIHNHPHKHLGMKKIIEKLNLNIRPCQIIYIDDRKLHVNDIKKTIGEITFIHMWKDVKDYNELKDYIIRLFNNCK